MVDHVDFIKVGCKMVNHVDFIKSYFSGRNDKK
jgi:hypothetical protein